MINVRQLSLALASAATLGLAALPAAAQNITVVNNSFEANSQPGAGYGTITGWNGGINTGVNNGLPNAPAPAPATRQPFADNGAVPDGAQVAFMQTNGNAASGGNVQQSFISQTLSGFTVGQQYVLTFFDNARAASNAEGITVFFGGTLTQLTPSAGSLVTDTGTNIYSNTVAPVAAAANSSTPYNMVSVTFTPTATSGLLAFVGTNNGALLLDNVSVAAAPAAAPEPSQSAALGLGILGLAGLAFTARKRSRLSA